MTENLVSSAALTEEAVRELVRGWYVALDRHVDLEQVLPYLVEGVDKPKAKGKPLTTDEADQLQQMMRAVVTGGSGRVLNVAGPRESGCPGVHAQAKAFLREVLSEGVRGR